MAPFVAQIDLALTEKMRSDLIEQGFSISAPQYTLFQAKKVGVSCTLYTSGKLVVQGKEMAAFIQFYLEPEILHTFEFGYPVVPEEGESHMGSDESGKGDYFGPLCIATVYSPKEKIHELATMGVKDSKKLSDPTILALAKKIIAQFDHHIIKIGPLKYNELITKFGNLNFLLAWAHATAIEALLQKTGSSQVIIDRFAHESVMMKALKQKNIDLSRLEVIQRTGGEADLVVAAASVVARATFVQELKQLSSLVHHQLPKGANHHCIEIGKKIVQEQGKEALGRVAKLHFKTTQAIFD